MHVSVDVSIRLDHDERFRFVPNSEAGMGQAEAEILFFSPKMVDIVGVRALGHKVNKDGKVSQSQGREAYLDLNELPENVQLKIVAVLADLEDIDSLKNQE